MVDWVDIFVMSTNNPPGLSSNNFYGLTANNQHGLSANNSYQSPGLSSNIFHGVRGSSNSSQDVKYTVQMFAGIARNGDTGLFYYKFRR